jgi:hypothetical protein
VILLVAFAAVIGAGIWLVNAMVDHATCTCTVGVIRGGRYTLGDRIQAGNRSR